MMAEKKKFRDRVRDYFRSVIAELKKVSWPTRKEIINSTVTVIILCYFWALFIGGCDYLFAFLMKSFLARGML